VDLIASHQNLRFFGEAISKTHPAVVSGQVKALSINRSRRCGLDSTNSCNKWRAQQGLEDIGGDGFEHGLADLRSGCEERIHLRAALPRHSPAGPLLRQHGGRDRGALLRFGAQRWVAFSWLMWLRPTFVRRYLDTGAKSGSHEERKIPQAFSSVFCDRDPYMGPSARTAALRSPGHMRLPDLPAKKGHAPLPGRLRPPVSRRIK